MTLHLGAKLLSFFLQPLSWVALLLLAALLVPQWVGLLIYRLTGRG